MPRLYRPHIPLSVRVKVAALQLRQRGQGDFVDATHDETETWGDELRALLRRLSVVMGCAVDDLRLDHDPALGARQKRGEGRRTVYTPAANDPNHLFYRPHGPEFDGSHLIKTNVRGEHGQHPDRVLIKKAKRLERGPRQKPKRKWASRPFPKQKRSFR